MLFQASPALIEFASPLAVYSDSGDKKTMAKRQRLNTTRFENDATKVLSRIKATLSPMILGLGVSRPVDLQRLLKLDSTLSWQLFKILTERDVLASGAAMPSRASLEKFSAAAVAHGASAELAAALSAAYERFEAVVERHAGDRTTFISLATSVAGVNDDWLATDLQHRRHAFRAFSHAMGAQAQTRVVCQILGDEAVPSEEGYRFAFLSGYVNLRTLRQIKDVRVYGSMIVTQTDDPTTKLLQRWPLGRKGKNVLLSDYCSKPLPELVINSGTHERYQWTDMAMISPEVGNLGAKTVLFGEEFLSPILPDGCHQKTNIPSEVLIMDLVVPAGRLVAAPSVEVFLGDRMPLTHSPDSMPLLGTPAVMNLGRGAGVLKTPEVPQYADMVRSVADKVGFLIDDYEVWRVRLEYPYYQSTTAMSWKTRTMAQSDETTARTRR